MHDEVAMRVRHGAAYVLIEAQYFCDSKTLFAAVLVDRAPVHELHHDVRRAVLCGAAIEQARAGNVDVAVATLERLVAAEPERALHLHALVDVLLDAGRADDAAARMQHLPVNVDVDPEIVRRRARLELVRTARAPDAGARSDAASAFLESRREEAFERWLDLLRAAAQREAVQRDLRAAFTLLGDHDELAVKYRRRMAALLH